MRKIKKVRLILLITSLICLDTLIGFLIVIAITPVLGLFWADIVAFIGGLGLGLLYTQVYYSKDD